MLENIIFKIEGLSFSIQNQLSFNKMIESKLAQIVAAIPVNNEGKIPGQPENSFEKVNAVTTRGGKSTHDPPNPNNKAGKKQGQQEEGPSPSTKTQKIKKKMRKQHHKTLLIQATWRFQQGKESRSWMSNSLILRR